ncbi:unnamed protein product [Medioppia subpectinata]|uniref:CAP-Gly domain-containing protein n=1 Tax=Medioppia subpectinata TaxID=1979941 RepID=A0A7R9L557_9ACAR|nr:unnamed protein product [Medioppia subpectinata]CAG2114646.1 unnamed protein product [Medioppia subpectinata]
MLQKAAEHIRQLKSDRHQQQEEYDLLIQQVDSLNQTIGVIQSQMPATGVPVSSQRSTQTQELYENYIRERTLQNWKFWIFNIIMKSLWESYNQTVTTSNMDEMSKTIHRWIEHNCCLIQLRKDVLNSLRFLSTSTNILTDPKSLPDEAILAVTKKEKPLLEYSSNIFFVYNSLQTSQTRDKEFENSVVNSLSHPALRPDMDDSAAFSRGSSVLTADTDDFIVGDRVWVNGSKPGYIQFIGETKFAKGEWAGIVLDNFGGKNDGSINGVRYFQCEPYRGIFARLYRLSRYPTGRDGQRLYNSDTGILKTHRSTSPDGKTTTTRYATTAPIPHYALPTRGPAKVITKTITTTLDGNNNFNYNYKIGDLVVVDTKDRGFQTGRVRYFGGTSFASGQWVGVELNEPNGKNDGSVAGKSPLYFTCSPKYGLFSPIDRVVKGEPTRSITKTRIINTAERTGPWKVTRFQY